MALELQATYAKKLGLPGYSSHGLTLSLKQEINSPDQIDEVVTETYQRLQAAIDRELRNVGWLPDGEENQKHQLVEPSNNGNHRNGSNGFQHNGRNGSHQQPWNCSEKQKNLIQRVAREQGLSHEDLNALAQARFRKDIKETNKLEASGLIDELLSSSQQQQQVRTPAYSESSGRNGR